MCHDCHLATLPSVQVSLLSCFSCDARGTSCTTSQPCRFASSRPIRFPCPPTLRPLPPSRRRRRRPSPRPRSGPPSRCASWRRTTWGALSARHPPSGAPSRGPREAAGLAPWRAPRHIHAFSTLHHPRHRLSPSFSRCAMCRPPQFSLRCLKKFRFAAPQLAASPFNGAEEPMGLDADGKPTVNGARACPRERPIASRRQTTSPTGRHVPAAASAAAAAAAVRRMHAQRRPLTRPAPPPLPLSRCRGVGQVPLGAPLG